MQIEDLPVVDITMHKEDGSYQVMTFTCPIGYLADYYTVETMAALIKNAIEADTSVGCDVTAMTKRHLETTDLLGP